MTLKSLYIIELLISNTQSIALFGYTLVAFLVSDPVNSRVFTLPYRAMVLVLSLICLTVFSSKKFRTISSSHLAFLQQTYRKPKYYSLIIGIFFSFIILYSLRLIYDTQGSLQDLSKEPSEYIITWFCITLIPALTFSKLQRTSSSKFLYISIIILSIASMQGIRFAISGDNASILERGRLGLAAINPISLGHCGVSLTVLSIYLWMKEKSVISKPLSRDYLLLSASLGLILTFLSGSRGPLASLIACISILIFCNRKKKKSIILIFTFVFISVVSMLFALARNSSILLRLANPLGDYSGEYNPFINRGQLTEIALDKIVAHPLLGYGIELFGYGYPHNLIIEAFLATGLIGGTLFLFLFVFCLFKSICLMANSKIEEGWVGLLYIQFAVASLFSGSLYASNYFWYLLVAVLNIKYYKFSQPFFDRATIEDKQFYQMSKYT